MPDQPVPVPTTCYCGAPMRFKPTGRFKRPWYGCSRYPECDGVIGAHPDGRPLGRPAPKVLRQARIAAHEEFDRLWKRAPNSKLHWRKRAYLWLQEQLGSDTEVHMGEADAATCLAVMEACRGKNWRDVERWWRARRAS